MTPNAKELLRLCGIGVVRVSPDNRFAAVELERFSYIEIKRKRRLSKYGDGKKVMDERAHITDSGREVIAEMDLRGE